MQDPSPIPRERLMVRFRDHADPDSLGEVFDRTAARSYRFATAIAGDAAAAEDALQETFLSVVRDAQSWDPWRAVLPWLTGSLRPGTRRRAAS